MPKTENRFFPAAGTASAAVVDPTRRTTHPNLILAICCMSLLIVGMDVTIVNVALPAIQKDLHARLAGLQWILDAYTLVVASVRMVVAVSQASDVAGYSKSTGCVHDRIGG